jgi:hypothetical protein
MHVFCVSLISGSCLLVPDELVKEMEECEKLIRDYNLKLMTYNELLAEANEKISTGRFHDDGMMAPEEEEDILKLRDATMAAAANYQELIDSTTNGVKFQSNKRDLLARYERGIRLIYATEVSGVDINLDKLLAKGGDNENPSAPSTAPHNLQLLVPLKYDDHCVHVFQDNEEDEEDDIGLSIVDQLREKLVKMFNYNIRRRLRTPMESSKMNFAHVSDQHATDNNDTMSVMTTDTQKQTGPTTVTEYISIIARLKAWLGDIGFDPDSRMLALTNKLINNIGNAHSTAYSAFSRGGTLEQASSLGEPLSEDRNPGLRLDSLTKVSVTGGRDHLMRSPSEGIQSTNDDESDNGGSGDDKSSSSAPRVPMIRPQSSTVSSLLHHSNTASLTRAPTSLEGDEQPYLVPIMRCGLFAELLARIPLKRGLTLVRGSELPYIQSIARHASSGDPDDQSTCRIFELRPGTGLGQIDDDDDDVSFDSGVRLQDGETGNYNMPLSSTKLRGLGKANASSSFHHIRVNGPGMEPLHARFSQQGGVNIHITPNHIETGSGSSIVLVNGSSITEATQLQDGDLIQLGYGRFFKICIPRLREAEEDDDDENDITIGEDGTYRVNTASNARDSESRGSSRGRNRAQTPVEKIMRRQQFLMNKGKNGKKKSKKSKKNKAVENVDSENDAADTRTITDKFAHLSDDLGVDSEALLTAYERSLVLFYQSYLKACIRKYETARRHSAHLTVDREGASIATNKEKSELMLMDTFEPSSEEVASMLSSIAFGDRAKICEIIAMSILLSYWSKDMRRGVQFEVRFRPVPANDRAHRMGTFLFQIPANYRFVDPAVSNKSIDALSGSTVKTLFSADMLCTTMDNNGNSEGCWWWTVSVLLERFSLLSSMRDYFLGPECDKNSITLEKQYPEEIDPFQDTLDVS